MFQVGLIETFTSFTLLLVQPTGYMEKLFPLKPCRIKPTIGLANRMPFFLIRVPFSRRIGKKCLSSQVYHPPEPPKPMLVWILEIEGLHGFCPYSIVHPGIPPEKIFEPINHTQSTFSGAVWMSRDRRIPDTNSIVKITGKLTWHVCWYRMKMNVDRKKYTHNSIIDIDFCTIVSIKPCKVTSELV